MTNNVVRYLRQRQHYFVNTTPLLAHHDGTTTRLRRAIRAPAVLPQTTPTMNIRTRVSRTQHRSLTFDNTGARAFRNVNTMTVRRSVNILGRVHGRYTVDHIIRVRTHTPFTRHSFQSRTQLIPNQQISTRRIDTRSNRGTANSKTDRRSNRVRCLRPNRQPNSQT